VGSGAVARRVAQRLNQQLTATKTFNSVDTLIGRGVYLIWIKACRADLLFPTAAEKDLHGVIHVLLLRSQ
jgi:hypothetical protein